MDQKPDIGAQASGWRLRTSPASPFGRKIRMAIAALGLDGHVQVEAADTADPQDSLRAQNPLGKIPILLLEDGTALFDSRVIVDFLNEADGRGVLIPMGPERYTVLVQQAMADGLLDAAILLVYEGRFRPADRHAPNWLAYQQDKVRRALDRFEHAPPERGKAAPHIGEIALAAALGYLDLRFQGAWRTTHPRLAQWLHAFEQRFPAYEQTRFQPDKP